MANTSSIDEGTAKAILRQVEFYFSDSNLPRDKFLINTVNESEDGMVPINLICSFSRMKRHLGLDIGKAAEVPEEIVQAVSGILRGSSLIKVSEDGKRVSRTTELLKPEEVIEQVDSRTLAVYPLPYDTRLEDVESSFSLYGKVNSVRLPRHFSDKKLFCGTALIEFSNEEIATNILKESLVYAGAELEVKTKKDFDAERIKMQEAFEKSSLNNKEANESGSYPKGLILSFKINNSSNKEKVQPVESKNENNGMNTSESTSKIGESVSSEVQKEKIENTSQIKVENAPQNLTKGNGEKASEVSIITREDLKEVFKRFGTIKYVDYKMGDSSGYIRFEDPDATIKARATAAVTTAGGLVVKKHIITLEAISGEAEKEYWSSFCDNHDGRKDGKSNRGRGKSNKSGKRFEGKQSKEVESGDIRQAKVQKISV